MKNTCKKVFALACIMAMLVTTIGRHMPVHAESRENTTDTMKEKALEWLKQTQNENQSYGDVRLINDTADVGEVLKDCSKPEDNTWLTEQAVVWGNNTDSLARLYSATGEEKYLTKMLKFQNKDGGFGLNADYRSDMLDSALAYEALVRSYMATGQNENQIMQLMEYLMTQQNADGGYSYIKGGQSDYMLTVKIALITTAYTRHGEKNCDTKWLAGMEEYLAGPSYEFGEETFVKAAYQQMYACLGGSITDTAGLEEQLAQLQQEDGSFYGKQEETMAAIRLLGVIEEVNKPYININSLKTELSSYVLYNGFESSITVKTNITYKTNQSHEGRLVTEVFRDGEVICHEEEAVTLDKMAEELTVTKEVALTGEAGKTYELKTQLFMEEVVAGTTTDALNVQNPQVDELILSGGGAEDGIKLCWNDLSNEFVKYGYQIYRMTEGNEWETRSSWDGEEKVRVLNVYPAIQAENNLKNWMLNDLSGGEGPAGKGLFEIDTVYIEWFNKEPEAYLFDENGNYKYDVLFFGAYDSNGNRDLNERSYQATLKFIESGRGVLFGHDSVLYGRTYFMKFEDLMGVKLKNGSAFVLSNQVKVVNTGALTGYPWKVEGILNIPTSHAWHQYTGSNIPATVWMEFVNGGPYDPETGAYANAYLFSHNQLAMIQTGHSNGQATDDERKVLANTLFYLKQLTNETQVTDKSAYDKDAPGECMVGELIQNEGTLQFAITAEDTGTTYQYYVEAIPQGEGMEEWRRQSNVIEAVSISGINGYAILINDSEATGADMTQAEIIRPENGNITYPMPATEEGKQYYLHIRAVDNTGNMGPETILLVPAPKEELPDCFNTGYSLYGSEDITIYCSGLSTGENTYSGGNFTFGGSSITSEGIVEAVGSINAYAGSVNLAEQKSQTEAKEMPWLHESILAGMGGAENLEVLNAYDSTQIDAHTWCVSTTGAYCPQLTLNASLMCDNTINIGTGSISCGENEKVVLYSVNGDISINAQTFVGSGIIYAPNGTVTINVQDMQYKGSIIAKKVIIQGSNINIVK